MQYNTVVAVAWYAAILQAVVVHDDHSTVEAQCS